MAGAISTPKPGAKVLSFPVRPSPEQGVLLGRSARYALCPKCAKDGLDVELQVFIAHWRPHKPCEPSARCPACASIYGPPAPEPAGQVVELGTGKIRAMPVPGRAPLRYAAVAYGDGTVRLSFGSTNVDPETAFVLSPAEAEKIAADFHDIARAAAKQAEQLVGDDRWRVRVHPERSGVYLVRHHLYQDRYREVPFVATEIRRERRCEACHGVIAPGATMYREEKPVKWANPNWSDVRICTLCVQRVDRGSPAEGA